MRFIQLSLVLPVLALVSANMDSHIPSQRQRRHGDLARLVARQRSSSGVLGPLLGDEEESSTIATPPAQSTVLSSSTRTPIASTDDDTPATPTPSPSSSSTITPETLSSSSATSLISSASSIVSSGQVASASNSSTLSSSASSNTSSAVESSTSSMTASAEPSMSLSVDAGGETIVVTVMQSIVTESAAPTQAPAASSAVPEKKDDDDGLAIPMGAIIGISVGAGLVILMLIGLAVWRMKKRSVDDDDAIRWPELNRHGDSDAHHALPAVQTGKHGIETSPLERSNSNSSSIFAHSVAPAYDAAPVPMALNGSDFGGTTNLDDDYYEKSQAGHDQPSQAHGYDLDHDYTSYPPVVQPHTTYTGVHGAQDPDSSDDGMGGARGHATYGQYR